MKYFLMFVLMCVESCAMSLYHRNRMNQHFLQALDDVYEKMFGENNLKSGGD